MMGKRHGRGMGTAWSRHAVCESAINLRLSSQIGLLYIEPYEICYNDLYCVKSWSSTREYLESNERACEQAGKSAK